MLFSSAVGMPCDQYKRTQEKLEMIMDIDAGLHATQASQWIGHDGVSILTKQFNKGSITALDWSHRFTQFI